MQVGASKTKHIFTGQWALQNHITLSGRRFQVHKLPFVCGLQKLLVASSFAQGLRVLDLRPMDVEFRVYRKLFQGSNESKLKHDILLILLIQDNTGALSNTYIYINTYIGTIRGYYHLFKV